MVNYDDVLQSVNNDVRGRALSALALFQPHIKFIELLCVCGHFCFLNLCCCDVNIAHGGHDDLKKHCATQKHLNAASGTKFQLSVSVY